MTIVTLVLDQGTQATLKLDDVRSPIGPVGHASPSGLSVSGRVVRGWEGLLDRYAWDWFATFTFRDEVHPEAADKLFRVWVSLLNRVTTGTKNWHKRPRDTVRWARGLEWQKRGVLHYHALLYTRQGLNHLERFAWTVEWERLGGGYARILPCDSSPAVRAYIAKYCGKGGEVDVSLDLPAVLPGRVGVRA